MNRNGRNWIRPEKRLALYLRDGLACVYCGASLEDGALLTLDYLRPVSKGGSNAASNLVTVCHTCNSNRKNRTVRGFCRAVASYLDRGVAAREIEQHVRRCAARTFHTQAARTLIAQRGGWTPCLSHYRGTV